jgi:hypothetical protein
MNKKVKCIDCVNYSQKWIENYDDEGGYIKEKICKKNEDIMKGYITCYSFKKLDEKKKKIRDEKYKNETFEKYLQSLCCGRYA